MHDTLVLLKKTDFPPLRRERLEPCRSTSAIAATRAACIATSTPARTAPRRWTGATVDLVLEVLEQRGIGTLDITGGAPELNAAFPPIWCAAARALGMTVIDRCNLTILLETGPGGSGGVPRRQRVEVVASLPCYSRTTSTASAATACSTASIEALRRLNALGYGDRQRRARAQPRLQPAGRLAAAAAGRARGRLQARAVRRSSACASTGSSPSPTCRSSASAARSSRRGASTTT